MLLDATITWARDAGVRIFTLGVTYGDTPAVRLYTRAGFRPLGPPQPCRPGTDLLGLEMDLDLRGDGD